MSKKSKPETIIIRFHTIGIKEMNEQIRGAIKLLKQLEAQQKKVKIKVLP